MPTREELEQALDALEAQRESLGDTAVEAAQAGLRHKLAQVLATERDPGHGATPDPGGGSSPRRYGPQVYVGDHRTNTGMYEGVIAHAEVNAAISTAEKVILFGQQTRLRSRRLLADERLSRIQPGHKLSKFFYGGVRQLPERLLDALLAKAVSVTLVRGHASARVPRSAAAPVLPHGSHPAHHLSPRVHPRTRVPDGLRLLGDRRDPDPRELATARLHPAGGDDRALSGGL
jgi:hypothetical protein